MTGCIVVDGGGEDFFRLRWVVGKVGAEVEGKRNTSYEFSDPKGGLFPSCLKSVTYKTPF